ncbi:MAG: dockerin type I domain-containing protein, partial [Rhodopirellula sp. JB053]
DVIIEFNTTVNERTNPAEPTDVNRNGFVTALDALMIINLLNEGTGATSGGIPIGTIPAEDDNYYDVNDDGIVTAVDALRVINMLNSQDNFPSSEPIAVAPSSPDAASVDSGESASVSTVSSGTAKVVGGTDAESEPDLLELIAIDNAAESSDSDRDDDSLTSNLDAAIADLF